MLVYQIFIQCLQSSVFAFMCEKRKKKGIKGREKHKIEGRKKNGERRKKEGQKREKNKK
jgi:hypothetical protein